MVILGLSKARCHRTNSLLAHLEPELELFEVGFGDDGDDDQTNLTDRNNNEQMNLIGYGEKNQSQNNSSAEISYLWMDDGKHCKLVVNGTNASRTLGECVLNVEQYEFLVEGVILTIVSFVGILGNFASFVKFSQQRSQRLFHYLLLGLATFDMVYLVGSFLCFCFPALKGASCWLDFYCLNSVLWGLPLAHIGLMGSLYMTVCVSVERYITLAHPYWRGRWELSFWHFFLPIIFGVLVFKTPKFLELRLPLDQKWGVTRLRDNLIYVCLYIGLAFFLFEILLPFTILIYCNTSVVRLLRQHRDALPKMIQGPVHPSVTARRTREVRLASISVYIAAVCLCCHLLRLVPTFWEVLERLKSGNIMPPNEPMWLQIFNPVCNVSLAITSSSNFYIYWTMYGRPRTNCKSWASSRSSVSNTTTITERLTSNLD